MTTQDYLKIEELLVTATTRQALRVIVDEKLAERAAEMGGYLLEQLAEIPTPHFREMRGKGLLIGIELKYSAGGGRRFCEALGMKNILAKETHVNTIRIAPSLLIEKAIIYLALPSIREVLNMN